VSKIQRCAGLGRITLRGRVQVRLAALGGTALSALAPGGRGGYPHRISMICPKDIDILA